MSPSSDPAGSLLAFTDLHKPSLVPCSIDLTMKEYNTLEDDDRAKIKWSPNRDFFEAVRLAYDLGPPKPSNSTR